MFIYYDCRINNKRDLLLHLANYENKLDELKKLKEKKQRQLVELKQNNTVEIDYLKKELYYMHLIQMCKH